MAWTCANCGTKNESGLFNFCKKCGSTPSREPSAGPTAPTARHAPQSTRQPHVGESTCQRSSGGRRRRSGSNAFVVIVLLVLVAAGAVVAVASRVDVRDAVDDALRDLTQEDPGDGPALSTGTDPGALGEFTDDLLAESILEDALSGTDGTTAPGTTAPAVAPVLAVTPQRDRRCANRWNGAQNARARRAIVAAAEGARLWAGVQLAGGVSGSVDAGVCVIVFGTQPDPAQPALRPREIYAEAGPASGPRLPFRRLGTATLSYQWNARVARDGRILPKTAS